MMPDIKMHLLFWPMKTVRLKVRTKNAGRITPEMGLTDDQWKIFAEGAEKVAKL